GVEREDEALGRQRRPKDRRPPDPLEEEGDEEEPQDDAVEDASEDVDRLDQVLGQVGEKGEAYRDQPPECREALRGDDVVRVARLAPDDVSVDVDGRRRAEGVELARLRRKRGG